MAEQAVSIEQGCGRTLDTKPAVVPSTSPYFVAFARRRDDGLHEIVLMVDGVHCAGCIGKIESAIHSDRAVREARLNFSTRRLKIVWDGPAERIDAMVDAVKTLGYKLAVYDPARVTAQHEHENRFLLLCTGVAGFAAGNIMLLSFALWTTTMESMGVGTRDFLHWISALIAIPAIAFSGRPFFYSAFGALRAGGTNMDVPISLALILATGMSVFQLVNHAEDAYFDSAVMLMFFLLIGRYLDFHARARARGAAGDLLSLMGGAATVLDGGTIRVVPVAELHEGMIVQIGMGERIPADGKVIDGQSEIDISLLTGESLPCAVGQGDVVHSGAVNMSAPLKISLMRRAEDSFLADVIRLMEKAEQGQSAYVRLADRVARFYTPFVHTLAAASFIVWFFVIGAQWQDALLIAITVLIITCPCAMGLAVPVVQVLAVGRLMRDGIMVKAGDALERLAEADTVFLDKTGTLTIGKPVLQNAGEIADDDFRMAASLAVHSRHPLSRALAAAWRGPVLDMAVVEFSGLGLEAKSQGGTVRLGRRSWCAVVEKPDAGTHMELWLAMPGRDPVRFVFSDPLRTDARDVLRALSQSGKKIRLLSGDRESVVARVAGEVEIDEWQAEMTPEEKFAALRSCQSKGHRVLMVGDGLNDAPVLAGADVSMSPSSAIDIAQNAADIVFTGEHLRPLVRACAVADFAQKLVRQNFRLSILYNIIAVPLAVTGQVTPLVAAIAMSLSSLLVILNSFRLVRQK